MHTSHYLALTWNIEGFARNVLNLRHYVDLHHPDFIFLSEPQIYANDLELVLGPLSAEYVASLNSADQYDPSLPLVKSKAHGGTLILWQRKHDPFVSVWPVSTTAFLPILFHPPGSSLSIHIAIYLPTAGKDVLFVDELSNLCATLEELSDAHPNAPIHLRGDFNVSNNNSKRVDILSHFCQEYSFNEVPLFHSTYHHFVGQLSSSLDRIFVANIKTHSETLLKIHCKLSEPLINSHHDIIVSSWSLPHEEDLTISDDNIIAPKLHNNRSKVLWSDEGIQEYQDIVVPHLLRLQELWLSTPSRTSTALLLESTSNLLSTTASLTNRTLPLDGSLKPKQKCKTPKAVKLSQRNLLKLSKNIKNANPDDGQDVQKLVIEYKAARIDHRKLERKHKAGESWKRDQALYSICSKDPSPVFKSIRSSKRSTAGKIHKLTVGQRTYVGDSVKDGFFDSISQLKSRDHEHLKTDTNFCELVTEYRNILEVCKDGPSIPFISETDSFKLLQKMKPEVKDVNSITINHYNYAGPAGWKHFNLLLNNLISDVNNTDIEEINTVYAVILFKGHKKDKSSSRSYRTISSCPVIAKSLDLYIRDLHIETWNLNQAETQFQGEGSSHDLAAVLLTETIQHSLFTLKQPIFILYLDAESAFDVVLKEILVKNLFNCSTTGHSLIYINNRLGNRKTVLDWDGNLL